jgi:hypothetical protein
MRERGCCLAMNESQRRRAARCYMYVGRVGWTLSFCFDDLVLTMRCAARRLSHKERVGLVGRQLVCPRNLKRALRCL